MIRVVAHLKKNNFRLFCEGEEYTNYSEETFESILPNKKLVVFTLQKGEGEASDEIEFLIKMDSLCPQHKEKFLRFYCFNCDNSICIECFTKGIHKGHRIQDKCYYLLPSKFLVEKMFESWSKNPYEDYKISNDLTDFKNQLNNVFFAQLFQMLKNIQNKLNDLIDYYNCFLNNSLNNLRNSVRDINVAYIKALDNLKEKLKIKDIMNNNNIFKIFNDNYNKLKTKENENFQKRMNDLKKLDENGAKCLIEFIERTKKNIFEFFEGVDENLNKKKIEISGKNGDNNINNNNIENENIIEEEGKIEENNNNNNIENENVIEEEEKIEEKNEEHQINEEQNEEKNIHNKSSKYWGVSKNGSNWRVQFCFNGENYKLGTFQTEKDAAKLYDIFTIKARGTEAKTNFCYTKKQKKKFMKLP